MGLDMNEIFVRIIIGSASDWDTMKHCAETLEKFGVPYDKHIASAHRTPEKAKELSASAESQGVKVIIAAAGGAAHLAGAIAANTHLPVLGVPMKGWAFDGLDSLLSTVQMPRGIPVATFAVGKAGAVNSAIAAVQILALSNPAFREKLLEFRKNQTMDALNSKFPE